MSIASLLQQMAQPIIAAAPEAAAPSTATTTESAGSGTTSGGTSGGSTSGGTSAGAPAGAPDSIYDYNRRRNPYGGAWWMENSAGPLGENLYHNMQTGEVLHEAPNFWWSNPLSGPNFSTNPDFAGAAYDPTWTPPTVNAAPSDATVAELISGLQAVYANPHELMSQLAGLYRSGYLDQLPDYTPEARAAIGQAISEWEDAREGISQMNMWGNLFSVISGPIGGMLAPAIAPVAGAYAPAVGAAGTAAAGSLAQGADFDQALQAGAMAGATAGLPTFAAPYINDAVTGFSDMLAGMNPDEIAALTEDLDAAGLTLEDIAPSAVPPSLAQYGVQPGMEPAFSVPERVGQNDIFGELQPSRPAMTRFSSADSPLTADVPADIALAATDPLAAQLAGIQSLDSTAEPTTADMPTVEEAPLAQEPEEPLVAAEDVSRYMKVAKALQGLLGGDEGTPPEGAPTQDEGESQEQYVEELATYAEETIGIDLSAGKMAELGLQPGTPEYLEYIMAESDRVINEILGDMDVDAEDFAAQLRAKTNEELMQLQRALYVRGQLGALTGSGSVVNPVTGAMEEVSGEGMFNPGTAGYQRSRASDIQELAGMGGPDALAYLEQLLGRSFDPYSMQSAADARFEQAKRSETDEMERTLRRRRGMLS